MWWGNVESMGPHATSPVRGQSSGITNAAGTSVGQGCVADLVNLVGLHGRVFGPVVDETELPAFVEGATQVGLPFGRIRLIHALVVFARFFGPGLSVRERRV